MHSTLQYTKVQWLSQGKTLERFNWGLNSSFHGTPLFFESRTDKWNIVIRASANIFSKMNEMRINSKETVTVFVVNDKYKLSK